MAKRYTDEYTTSLSFFCDVYEETGEFDELRSSIWVQWDSPDSTELVFGEAEIYFPSEPVTEQRSSLDMLI